MIFANIYGCRIHTPDSTGSGECTCTVFTSRKRPENVNIRLIETKTGETVDDAVIRYRGYKITWYEKKLPGPWYYCEECQQSYRPLTVRANGKTPSTIQYKSTCWPCYDGFYDCCYGPDGNEYEYSGRIRGLAKRRKKWREMKEQRKANHIARKALAGKLKEQGYPRNTAKRMAKEIPL